MKRGAIILLSILILNTAYANDDDNVNQGPYFSFGLSRLFHVPKINFVIVLEDIGMDGAVPHSTSSGIDMGIGYKKGNIRISSNFNWTRLHLDKPQIDGIAFSPTPLSPELENHYIDSIETHIESLGTLNYLAIECGLHYDIDLTDHFDRIAFIYIGGSFGEAGVDFEYAKSTVEYIDSRSIFNIDVGTILKVNDSSNVTIGYQYTYIQPLDYGFFKTDGHGRHAAVIGLHIYD